MNKEENIITEFVQHSTGFTFSKCDLTTGKVVINNIEITSVEDWNKVTKSLIELQQKVNQLETNIDEAIQKLNKSKEDGWFNLNLTEIEELLSILERGKE